MKEVTIYDIAESLGLSASTVSRALADSPLTNEDTRRRVKAYASEVGYRGNAVARNLRTQRSQTIGVIVPRFDSKFMSACLAGMEEVAREHGYVLLITQSQESSQREEENLTLLLNKRVDGILVSLTREESDLNYFRSYRDRQVPLVFFDRVPGQPGYTSFAIDNEGMAYEATRHLLEQGCRKLVHLTIPSCLDVYRDRAKGFERAIRETKDCHGEVIYLDELDLEYGRISAKKILENGADGVFAANDLAATGCLQELRQRGCRIPEDVAIVGFNNEEVVSTVCPNLSSVDYPGRETGQRAINEILKILDGGKNSGTLTVMPSRLIIRESSLRKPR